MILFHFIATTGLLGSAQDQVPAYDVVQPEGISGPRPVLLMLAGETPQEEPAEGALDWRGEALRRGWTVVSPAAPGKQRFNVEDLLELTAAIEGRYEPEYGKVHLAGLPAIVQGASRAALELALAAPDRFASLSLSPVVAHGLTAEIMEPIKDLPLVQLDRKGRAWPGWSPVLLFDSLESLRVHAALADFHDAAAQADGARYFGHFAPEAVFIGTDASERWTLEEFQAFARPYFDRGQGWTYLGRDRHVHLGPGGQTAWFDEMLDSESYGETRGTGVFVRAQEGWRMAQYHLTIPVPNELAKELVRMIRER